MLNYDAVVVYVTLKYLAQLRVVVTFSAARCHSSRILQERGGGGRCIVANDDTVLLTIFSTVIFPSKIHRSVSGTQSLVLPCKGSIITESQPAGNINRAQQPV